MGQIWEKQGYLMNNKDHTFDHNGPSLSGINT